MEYISSKDLAKSWGVSAKWVQILCAQGRIPGTKKIGRIYLIPDDAERPEDARIKTGKYCKSTKKGTDKIL